MFRRALVCSLLVFVVVQTFAGRVVADASSEEEVLAGRKLLRKAVVQKNTNTAGGQSGTNTASLQQNPQGNSLVTQDPAGNIFYNGVRVAGRKLHAATVVQKNTNTANGQSGSNTASVQQNPRGKYTVTQTPGGTFIYNGVPVTVGRKLQAINVNIPGTATQKNIAQNQKNKPNQATAAQGRKLHAISVNIPGTATQKNIAQNQKNKPNQATAAQGKR